MQSRVRFNRVPKKVPEKVPEKVLVKSQSGSGESSGRLWRRAGSGSTRFRRRFRRSSQKQPVARSSRRFPEKVWEALVQSQVRLDRPEKVPKKFWCKAKSSSMGSG